MPVSFTHPGTIGAQVQPDGSTRFRVWAPSAQSLSLLLRDATPLPMHAAGDGWFALDLRCPAGTRYKFRTSDGTEMPDPASRAQDGDVHGWSVVTDASSYRWEHGDWMGRPWHEAVVYELHPGTCGGFDGIRAMLPDLKRLGVTAVELMPVADFPGARNWGYDGVLPYAPDEAYGTPDAFKAMVDAAHGLGLMVMLDVVYNHFGPDGAYIHGLAKTFFDEGEHTPWGAAIDFRKEPVQQFFLQNALMWLQEYRVDGLRFDAVHTIRPQAFLSQLSRTLRAAAEPGRHVHLVLENESNTAALLRDTPDSPLFDAQWTDDWHHCVHVMLTGESEGYYEDFADAARLLARSLSEGFSYQGETSPHSGKPRGEASAQLPPTSFVICLQNHDQIGNRAMGERLAALADPEALRAATALLLTTPLIPMLFEGEEHASRTPFLFFTDHNQDLAGLVREGRREEFKHFAAFQNEETRARIPDPNARSTFEASVPQRNDASDDAFALHQRLLALRAARIVPGIPGAASEGAQALGERAVRAQWRLGTAQTLVVAANLGDSEVAVAAPAGECAFESHPGDGARAAAGTLAARSTVVFLAPATGHASASGQSA